MRKVKIKNNLTSPSIRGILDGRCNSLFFMPKILDTIMMEMEVTCRESENYFSMYRMQAA